MIVQKIQNALKGYVLVQATIAKEKRIVIIQLKIVYLDNVLIYAFAMVHAVVKKVNVDISNVPPIGIVAGINIAI